MSRPPILYGEDNGFFGRKHTPESLAKISASRTGKKRSDASRRAQSDAWDNKRQKRIGDGVFACTKCGLFKPAEDFPTSRKRRDGSPRYSYCRSCHAIFEHERKLKRFFHLTLEDEAKILSYQNGVCAICGRTPTGKQQQLATDHRHRDGLIRGKLCWICNRLLGFVKDDATRLQAAAAYLLNPPAVLALGEQRFGLPGKINTKKQRKLATKLEKLAIKGGQP